MAKTLLGVVSSDKPDKTIIVIVRSRKTHPLYKKQYSVSRRFMAHDEKNEAQVGDKVAITETRPLSARKRYELDRIIEKPVIRQEQSVEVVTAEPVVAEKAKEDKTAKPVNKAKKAESEE